MDIIELREKRAKVWEATKAFLESHRTEKGTLTAEDDQTYNRMMKDIDDLGKEIQRMEKRDTLDRQMSEPIAAPITGKPGAPEEKTGRASAAYYKAWMDAVRSNFRNVSNVLQEGVDADGGYLVPDEYDSRLIDVMEEESIVRSLATKITTSGEHKINIANTKPAAAWIDEGAALSFGDATFSQKLLDAHKLYVAVKVTEELLYDNAFSLDSYLLNAFGKALGNAEEDAFLNGNGTGKPTGIFDATGGGNVTKTLTAALGGDDMLDLIYALKRPYRRTASFIMNDTILLSLRKLKDTNGQYLWQPSYQAGEPDRVLSYPVYTSAYAPAKGIAFGDFSYYNIGDRGTRSISELRELFAGNGMIAYVAKERVDGKLVLPEAIKILNLKAD